MLKLALIMLIILKISIVSTIPLYSQKKITEEQILNAGSILTAKEIHELMLDRLIQSIRNQKVEMFLDLFSAQIIEGTSYMNKEDVRDIFTNRFTQKGDESVNGIVERNLRFIFSIKDTEISVNRSKGIIRGNASFYKIGSSGLTIRRSIELQTEKKGEYWYIVKTVGIIEMLIEEWVDQYLKEELQETISTRDIEVSK